MPRRMQSPQDFAAKRQRVVVLQQSRGGGYSATRRSCRLGSRMLCQKVGTCNVVGMRMRLYGPLQAQVVLAQYGQIALDLFVYGINDDRIPTDRVEQHIGIGAGGGIEKL